MERNLTPRQSILLKSALIAGAYVLTFIIAYTAMQMISRKSMVRNAVKASQAYWKEQERLNNIRLFGRDDAI